MSLNNTSDRYRYIYGTAAAKLEEDVPKKKGKRKKQIKAVEPIKKKSQKKIQEVEQTRQEREADSEQDQRIQSNRKRFYAVDARFMLFLLLAAIIVASASFVYVDKSAQLSSMAREIKQLKGEKAELMNKKATLQSEIDNSLDLEEIQTYAEENLNMIYPSGNKILYYQNDSDDYFRQFGNVTTGE